MTEIQAAAAGQVLRLLESSHTARSTEVSRGCRRLQQRLKPERPTSRDALLRVHACVLYLALKRNNTAKVDIREILLYESHQGTPIHAAAIRGKYEKPSSYISTFRQGRTGCYTRGCYLLHGTSGKNQKKKKKWRQIIGQGCNNRLPGSAQRHPWSKKNFFFFHFKQMGFAKP